MSITTHSLAARLQAVGDILDRRGVFKEVLVHQADDGFIVHGLEARDGYGRSHWTPTTILIESGELNQALQRLNASAPVVETPSRRWWR